MGFGVSGATAVVLVGVLVCAATVYPVVERNAERRAAATAAADERALDRGNAALAVANATYDDATDTLVVAVANVGTTTLAVSAVDLLVDGRYGTYDAAVAGSTTTDVWAPGETLTLTVTPTGSATPARVKIVAGPGVAVAAAVEVA